MCSVFKCLCLLNLYFVITVSGVRLHDLIQSKHNLAFGEPLAIQNGKLRSQVIFTTFLRKLFDVLVNELPERKLIRFCRTLNRHLKPMDYPYTKMLAEEMRYLSRMYRDDIKAAIVDYKSVLEEERPMRKLFLEAMDEVFTLREMVIFNDFIFDLKDYGREDKPIIEEETRKLLNMIVESVFKLSKADRRELERRLRKAIKEYKLN